LGQATRFSVSGPLILRPLSGRIQQPVGNAAAEDCRENLQVPNFLGPDLQDVAGQDNEIGIFAGLDRPFSPALRSS